MTPRRATRKRSADWTLALGYLRVSTEEQADEGASLASQQSRLQAYADVRGWYVVWLSDPGWSGKSLDRPAITDALHYLATGRADVLLAVALDRISRNVGDVADLMEASLAEHWALVTLRESIDTSTAMGRAFVQIAAVFAELERGLIAERVKAGMAQKRAEGEHMGRRTAIPRAIVDRIRSQRAVGVPYGRIAAELNSESVPTPGRRRDAPGAFWTRSSVQNACRVNPDPPRKPERNAP